MTVMPDVISGWRKLSTEHSMAKVLISAYACRPGYGSESGVGWSFATEVAKTHDVWVITRAENKPVIEAYLADHPHPRLHFIYQPLPNWVHTFFGADVCKGIRYYIWQRLIKSVILKKHAEVEFDLAHHVTWVRYWMPSYLAKLGIPFIWGPLGGGDSAPWSFWRDMGFRGQCAEIIRVTARWLGEHDPAVAMTGRGATLAFATTERTLEKLNELCNCPTMLLTEAGLTRADIDQLAVEEAPVDSKFRFISIGRLIHWKGFHFGLRAFAQAGIKNARYVVVGDGPELGRLRELASELGIEDRVDFCGRLSREETFVQLKRSHVLVHPSLHDSGGWVCLEAMGAGKPVICLDLGGPATQVTEREGFKVRAENPEQAVSDMAKVMQQIYSDDQLRERMGRSGQRRVSKEFLWDEKIRHINDVYADLLGQRAVGRSVPVAY